MSIDSTEDVNIQWLKKLQILGLICTNVITKQARIIKWKSGLLKGYFRLLANTVYIRLLAVDTITKTIEFKYAKI